MGSGEDLAAKSQNELSGSSREGSGSGIERLGLKVRGLGDFKGT